MKTINIYLTSQEARDGCQKIISLENQVAPLRITLEPEMRDNTKIVINNAQFYGGNGAAVTEPVTAIIHISPENYAGASAGTADRKRKNGNIIWLFFILSGAFVYDMIRNGRKILKAFAILFAIGLCVLAVFAASQKKPVFASVSAPGNDIVSTGQTDTLSGGQAVSDGAGGSGTAGLNAPGQTNTEIPAVLLQDDWSVYEAPEYCPKFVFHEDGSAEIWINLGDEYTQGQSTYEVYRNSGGLRLIAYDVSAFYLENALGPTVYLLESEDGTWAYQGGRIGFTDAANHFSADAGTVSVPCLPMPEVTVSTDYLVNNQKDELRINWVQGGRVSFDLDFYRLYGYENQIGFCAPDGYVYCFLKDYGDAYYDDTAIPQVDGVIRFAFSQESVVMDVLSVSNSAVWSNYTGQTYVFR